MNKMKLGQYFYGRHRRLFGVWICDHVVDGGDGYSGRFIDDFRTREEAREYVWKMNGWGTPKTALA